jgi:hypothetical protein
MGPELMTCPCCDLKPSLLCWEFIYEDRPKYQVRCLAFAVTGCSATHPLFDSEEEAEIDWNLGVMLGDL